MPVDPARTFEGRLTEAQDFKVYSVGAHPFGCERIGDLDSTAAGGEDAVYAGFGLEQTQRSARGVDLTMPLCHQIIPEPFCAFRLSPVFASKSPVNQLWC